MIFFQLATDRREDSCISICNTSLCGSTNNSTPWSSTHYSVCLHLNIIGRSSFEVGDVKAETVCSVVDRYVTYDSVIGCCVCRIVWSLAIKDSVVHNDTVLIKTLKRLKVKEVIIDKLVYVTRKRHLPTKTTPEFQ